MNTPRYHRKTIRKFLEYLDELGLTVYGQNMDPESGCEFPSLMDYDVDAIANRRRHVENGTLWRDTDG